eukprot:TRINITY_DN4081_c0_g1_i3.p1 TRINITY_DN4081_c0_g1~~TRINITY_DN4081_c0_g1_i3.p1  ORF type:complete len:379 (+),score=26.14 TRINITY_DN4081_c0_g1_i3:45-1181(+)
MKYFLLIFFLTSVIKAEYIINVLDFGAKGDGQTDDTAAIRAAFANCTYIQIRCTVLFPGTGTYLTGPFNLTTRTSVKISSEASILLNPYYYNFQEYLPLINGYDLIETSISGGGMIVGQGSKLRAQPYISNYPNIIECFNCISFKIMQINIIDSPNYGIFVLNSWNITLNSVNVTNDINDPSLICLAFDSCYNVQVLSSMFNCGGQHISIKATETKAHNFTISECMFGYGQGVLIGPNIIKNIQSVTLRDSTFIGSSAGIILSSYRNVTGTIESIICTDLIFISVGTIFSVVMNYGHESETASFSEYPQIQNISLLNLSGFGLVAAHVDCLSESRCTGFSLQNVSLDTTIWFYCNNVVGESTTVTPDPCPGLMGGQGT